MPRLAALLLLSSLLRPLTPLDARAQTGSAPVTRWDATVGSDGTGAVASIGLHRLWPVAADGRLRLGLGARWSAWAGGDRRLSTAEPRLIEAGAIDSLIVPGGWQNAMNLAAHLAVQVTPKIALGANLDLVGLGWGTTEVGTLRAPGTATTTRQAQASPPLWNRFGGGTRDRGTLASEFWLGWDVRRDVRLRAGLNHFVLEQTTPVMGTSGNTRHRRFGNALFLGVGRLFR